MVTEQNLLKQVIHHLEKENSQNICFLTQENIETWFQATLPQSTKLTDLQITKADRKTFEKLTKAGASIERGEFTFKQKRLFYEKRDFTKKAVITDEHLHGRQSNLVKLRAFLQFHKKIPL